MDDRTQYWNEKYVKYWKKRTEEADKSTEKLSKMINSDAKTASSNEIYEFLDLLEYSKDEKLLDFGCGFGRLYNYFKFKNVNYFGIDISQAMINEMIREYPDSKDKLKVSEGENLPFEDKSFDKVICLGVFDACYQERALHELCRVCNIGGYIVITGKNDNYFDDDEKALVAEINARAKGHPNYFTNVLDLMKMLKMADIEIVKERYFLRRADCAEQKYVSEIPDHFYEWRLILRKTSDIKIDSFEKFSDKYSKTWYRKK